MNKAYGRINWENYPSENTALNEANLNKMDAALNEVDNRVVAHETTKLDKATANSMVKNLSFNERTGIFTVTYLNGSTKELDTKLEKIATNFVYDEERQKLILTLIDGTTQEIDMSALITQYEFENSAYISFTVVNGKVKAEIINGSITADKLQPNFLADVTLQANSAKTSEKNAKVSEENAKQSEINAKNYADSAEPVASTANGLNPTLDNSTSAKIISFLGDGETIQTQSKYLTELTATDRGVQTNKIPCKKGDVIILSLGEARGLEVFEEHSDGTTGKIVKFGTETTWTHTVSANTVSVQLLIVGGTIDDNITITVNGSEYAPPSPTNEVPIYGAGESRNSLEITASTETKNGITSTVNSDKSVTFSGAYASMTYFLLGVKTLKAGTYKISGCPSGGGYNSYTLRVSKQEGDVGLATDFGSGVTLTLEEDTVIQTSIYAYSNDIVGKTFYPMIRLASVEDETYKAYGAHSLSVKSTGANIFGGLAFAQALVYSGSTNVVLDTDAKTVEFTNNSSFTPYLLFGNFKENTQYSIVLKGTHTNGGTATTQYNTNLKWLYDDETTGDIRLSNTGAFTNVLKSNADKSVKGIVYVWGEANDKVVLNYEQCGIFEGAITAEEFEPYTETTADIPLSSPLYDGDYIRLNMDGSGEESHKMKAVVFDGSDDENWYVENIENNASSAYIFLQDIKQDILCDSFTKVDSEESLQNKINHFVLWDNKAFNLYFPSGTFTDLTTWKARLAENPITVVYEKAEPTVTPLTAEQIAEFEKLRSFDGTTHVTCEAECEVQYFCDSVSGKAVAMVASKANTSAELPIGSVIMTEEQNTEKPKYGEWSYLFTQTLTGESGGTPRAVSVNVYQRRA